MLTWGWRIPFLVSIVLLGLGVYIRAKVSETPVFQAARARHPPLKLPALEAVRRSPRNFFVVVGARLAENALGYLYPVFGVSYLINNLHVPRNVAIMGTIAGSLALIIGALGFANPVGPHRAAPGLYFRRAVLGSLRLSVFPAGQDRQSGTDRAGLLHRDGDRQRRHVRAAGGLFRRTVRAASALFRLSPSHASWARSSPAAPRP